MWLQGECRKRETDNIIIITELQTRFVSIIKDIKEIRKVGSGTFVCRKIGSGTFVCRKVGSGTFVCRNLGSGTFASSRTGRAE